MNQLPRYVPRSMRHHGAHSGYDHLFASMGLQPARSAAGVRLARMLPGGLAWRLWRMRPQSTSAIGLEAELGAMPWLAFGRDRWCHFINGEDTYMFTPLWQRSANRSIATFHYPPKRLALRINPGSLACLHAAVIVGENQREFLEQILPRERIFHCHHPVDIDFFCPDASPSRNLTLVCSGSLFRDYDALREAHLALRAGGLEVETDVIGANEQQRAGLQGLPGLRLHTGVSDEKLLELYRGAAVGLLPLTDATANNALLEMLACGLPVVTSDVGGVPDYTRGSAARLAPVGDVGSLVMHTRALLENQALRQAEGHANRQHAAERFCYAKLAVRMHDIYAACRLL